MTTQDTTETTGLALHDGEQGMATMFGRATQDILRNNPDAVRALQVAVVHEMRRVPKLWDCNPDSMAAAAITCAELGLFPTGSMAHIHLIPRGGQATVQVGYRGYMQLARNAGVHVDSVGVVYADEVSQGLFVAELAPFHISHKFSLEDIDRADKHLVAAYASCIVDGTRIGVILTRAQIDSRMKKGGQVWKTEFAAMARKSAIKALCQGGQVPLAPKVLGALGRIDPDRQPTPAPAKAIDVQPEPAANPTEAAQAALGDAGAW